MGMMIRKTLPATFAPAAEDRSFTATLSTASPDRDNDRVSVAGWVLPKNVPLLWSHDHSVPAIGKWVNVSANGTALRGRMVFPPEGIHTLADTVYNLIKNGILNDVSVGFKGLASVPNDLGGHDFQKQELIEASVVNCPAQTDATIDRAAIKRWLGDASADLALTIIKARGDEVVLELADTDPIVLELVDEAKAELVFTGSAAELRAAFQRVDVAASVKEAVEQYRRKVAFTVQHMTHAMIQRHKGNVDFLDDHDFRRDDPVVRHYTKSGRALSHTNEGKIREALSRCDNSRKNASKTARELREAGAHLTDVLNSIPPEVLDPGNANADDEED